jgi:hypothetical protein
MAVYTMAVYTHSQEDALRDAAASFRQDLNKRRRRERITRSRNAPSRRI